VCALQKFKGGGDKNPGSTNKHTKFGQSTIRRIIKINATRRRILRLKCTKFDSWWLSICLFVCLHFRLRLRWSLAHTAQVTDGALWLLSKEKASNNYSSCGRNPDAVSHYRLMPTDKAGQIFIDKFDLLNHRWMGHRYRPTARATRPKILTHS